MLENRIGLRYARAILDLSQEQGKLAEVLKDFNEFLEVCRNNHDLEVLLNSPLINPDKKLKVINAIFKSEFEPITYSLFEITIRKRRESFLISIAESFIALSNLFHNITLAEVTSAVPLTDAAREEIRLKVGNALKTKLEIKEKTDSSLIGGVVIKVNDLLFDGSISTELNKIRVELKKNTYLA
jgi:F-type H+-transporting ATPase subunit delta